MGGMVIGGGATGLLRGKPETGHHRVTFVELFFDLVFVFAVTQLSHALLEHLSRLGLCKRRCCCWRCGGCGSTPPGSRTGSIRRHTRFGSCCSP